MENMEIISLTSAEEYMKGITKEICDNLMYITIQHDI